MTSTTIKYNSAGVTLTDQAQTDLQADSAGNLKVAVAGTPANSSNIWGYTAAGAAPATSQTLVKAAAGAGLRNYIKSAQISHATLGAAVEYIIQDGSTALWRGILQTAASDAGAYTLNFDPPLMGTANTAVNITFSAGTTGNVYTNIQGYVGA